MTFISLTSVILTWSSYFLFVFGQYILEHAFNWSLDYVVLNMLCTGVERSISYPIESFWPLDMKEEPLRLWEGRGFRA